MTVNTIANAYFYKSSFTGINFYSTTMQQEFNVIENKIVERNEKIMLLQVQNSKEMKLRCVD